MKNSAVYFVIPGDLDTPTGGYRYDRRLVDELRGRGLPVQVVSLSERFPAPDRAALEHAREALRALPDGALVMVDGLAFGVLDEVAAEHAQRLRLLALCHHPLALESGLDLARRQSLAASERRALGCARAVVVTSEHTRDLLVAQFGVPAARVVVALPGTDPVPFAPCAGHPARLLTVASLTPRKAHDVLIDALDSVRDLAWQARFVGGGGFNPDWARSLATRVNHLGLSERILFVGPADDLRPEYQAADLFVLPSRFEGYGMVFAEALAAGLPVIGTHAGAVPQVVPAAAGVLVPPDDAQALGAALRRLLTDHDERRRLQAGARQAAAALPGWRESAARVARLIDEVLRA